MNNKTKDIFLSLIFIIFLFTMLIVNILKKDDNISYSERRVLEKLPKITYNSIIDGTYFKKIDKYTTDQFIWRDNFRKIKIDIDLLTKNNYNKLYLYKDYIIEETYTLNKESILNITNKINDIKRTYLNETNNIYYSIVPDKNYFVNNDNLKLDYEKLKNIMNTNLDIKYIDIFNELSIEDYYKTDTHWKEERLDKVVNKLSTIMNFNTYNNKYKYISDFKGVYSSRILKNNINDKIYILDKDIDAKVYNFENNKYESIYNLDKLNSLDKYNIYLNGSVSLLQIINNNYDESKKDLIVFRDSYGSSLIPLLIDSYNSITVVDTRYINQNILNKYINFNNKDVLFLYSTLLINDSYSLK